MISIILPCYKAENHIRNMIEDVVAQTYRDWELIVVSNGEGRALQEEIVSEYIARDGRIHLLSCEVASASSARNLGMENARGEWITFVDADDRITPDHLALLLEGAADDIDIVIGGLEMLMHRNQAPRIYRLKRTSTIGKRLLELPPVSLQASWNKLYRTEIIRSNTIQFRPEIKQFEDWLFFMEASLLTRQIATVPLSGYKYNHTFGNSVSHQYRPDIKYVQDILQSTLEKFYNALRLSSSEIADRLHHEKFVYGWEQLSNIYHPDCPLRYRRRRKEAKWILKTFRPYYDKTVHVSVFLRLFKSMRHWPFPLVDMTMKLYTFSRKNPHIRKFW